MRLTNEEVEALKTKLYDLSPDAKLYLFGSRTDETKRGGDIDLLIISKEISKQDIRLLRLAFFEKFGEQKMDIIIDDGSFSDPFHKMIFQKAVEL